MASFRPGFRETSVKRRRDQGAIIAIVSDDFRKEGVVIHAHHIEKCRNCRRGVHCQETILHCVTKTTNELQTPALRP